MKLKNSHSILRFWQHHTDTKVNLCAVDPKAPRREEKLILKDAQPFFYNRKIDMCKASVSIVYIRITGQDKRNINKIINEYLAFSEELLHINVDPRRVGSLQDTALYLFESLSQKFPKATVQEGNWLHYAHRGGLMWCKNGFQGKTWKYDFTSFYPSLCNSDLLFPTGRAVKCFLDVKEILDLDIPAIYRVKMPEHGHFLLKLKPIDKISQDFVYATNLDLLSARNLSVPFELVEHDGKWPNCLQFEEVSEGKKVFGKYVDKLFPLKKKGISSGKQMLNVLTGLLVQKEKIHPAKDEVIDITDLLVKSMTPDGITFLSPKKHIFRHTDKARLGIFITAHGRRHMIKYFLDHNAMDSLVRVHTDGFLLTSPLPDECTVNSHELGGLKLEAVEDVYIKNMRKPEVIA